MGLAEWLSSFRRLHDLAKKGKLLPSDKRTYDANRDELARAMLQIQKLSLKPGESARQSLRVPRAKRRWARSGRIHRWAR